MQTTYNFFGQRLVERGIITQEQLDEAIRRQQTTMGTRKLGEILVRLGYISKSHITEGLADQLGIPIIKLSERDISQKVRSTVPGEIATVYRVVPIEERGTVLEIGRASCRERVSNCV